MARDIFTEPDLDTDTLVNLGPLTGMAGIWEGTAGTDVHPVSEAEGLTETDTYLERYELQPIDPQTNGPQYFYGLRYHVHIHKPNEVETFHDQVGYWLWEPAARMVTHTIAIPRGQVALAAANKMAVPVRELTTGLPHRGDRSNNEKKLSSFFSSTWLDKARDFHFFRAGRVPSSPTKIRFSNIVIATAQAERRVGEYAG
jgi:hypothetical protein